MRLRRTPSQQEPLVILGDVTGRDRERIATWAQPAMADLALDALEVRVGKSRRLKGLRAGANGKAIWLGPDVASYDFAELGDVVCEEVAHHKLVLAGVADGLKSFRGALIQEGFGHWYAYGRVVSRDPRWAKRVRFDPIRDVLAGPRLGYQLGGAVGMAAAGHEQAAESVRAWYDGRNAEPEARSLARAVGSILGAASDALSAAERLADFYAGKT